MDKHSKNIEKIIEILKENNFVVIRLDKHSIPDAIVTRSEIPIALEIQSIKSNEKAKRIENKTDFPNTLIINALSERKMIYDFVLKLAKEGLQNAIIKYEVQKTFNYKIPASTLSYWLNHNPNRFRIRKEPQK